MQNMRVSRDKCFRQIFSKDIVLGVDALSLRVLCENVRMLGFGN